MRTRVPSAALLALLLAVACRDETDEKPFERPTRVSVDPALLEGVTCADAPGALRSYVATLTDRTPFPEQPVLSTEICTDRCWAYDAEGEYLGRVTGAAGAGATLEVVGGAAGAVTTVTADETTVTCSIACDPVDLPSSAPVPCALPVAFAFIAAGHRYTARVEGYDRDDLVPFAKGSPELVDPVTGALVLPTWVWECGEPAIAVTNWTTYPRGCALLSEPGGTGETALVVPVSSLLGERACGDGEGEVAELRLTFDGSLTRSVGCDAPARFTADDGLELADGRTVRVDVVALAADGAAAGTTACFVKVARGVEATATCEPFPPVDGARDR